MRRKNVAEPGTSHWSKKEKEKGVGSMPAWFETQPQEKPERAPLYLFCSKKFFEEHLLKLEFVAQGTGQKKMDEGMRRDSTDQIKEIEYQPSADSRLNEVNDSIQGPDWFIKMKENQIESSLQQMQLGRQLVGRDNNELQRYSITQSGVVKTLQDVPSVQYQVTINNFSVLQSSKLEKYETGLFEACNHKWKLSLYPNGNTNRGGKDHLSLYLEIATKNLPRGWKVEVNMKLLVYDHKRDKFWAFQELIVFFGLITSQKFLLMPKILITFVMAFGMILTPIYSLSMSKKAEVFKKLRPNQTKFN
ncbi:hypothetical protein RJ639_016508 [Escallonia herrerae]|uniref:MATH domain-containing protein n=1 Tax=Escallonia herrerae TaxID=1293975 RepID=A0AA88VDR1_9ASTE|nr:hypothetical protein RJ639_016508 [Escallonia herrerae]